MSSETTSPPGYTLIWSGPFEYHERAQNRLALIVPLTIGFIFALLYLSFRRLPDTLLVIPVLFAIVHGRRLSRGDAEGET